MSRAKSLPATMPPSTTSGLPSCWRSSFASACAISRWPPARARRRSPWQPPPTPAFAAICTLTSAASASWRWAGQGQRPSGRGDHDLRHCSGQPLAGGGRGATHRRAAHHPLCRQAARTHRQRRQPGHRSAGIFGRYPVYQQNLPSPTATIPAAFVLSSVDQALAQQARTPGRCTSTACTPSPSIRVTPT